MAINCANGFFNTHTYNGFCTICALSSVAQSSAVADIKRKREKQTAIPY